MELNQAQVADLTHRGFTRRHLGRVLTLLTAGAAMPSFNEGSMAHAQLSSLKRSLPPGAVKINANEYASGPAPAALEALVEVAKNGNRYQYQETYQMMRTAAELEGLRYENIVPYPGSSIALHHGVITNVSPGRGLVTADPGYEAAARAASFIGAEVIRVPLLEDGRQDVKTMLAEAKRINAGMIYLCNPNNPTGVPVPRKEVLYAIENKPAGSTILLDEAYIHLCDEPYGSDLVKQGEDVIVLRTFSKIYGMAGLRAGFAFARPDLLTKMRGYSSGALPATAMVAANASLEDSDLVPARKKMTAELRNDLFRFFDQRGHKYTPSESTKFMVEVGMPVESFISRMSEEKIFVGRPWPSWPTWNRVSIGTAEEMEKFKKAFVKVTTA